MSIQHLFLLISTCWLASPSAVQADSAASSKPRKIPPFELQTSEGETWRLDDAAGVLVVAFLGTECPLVKLYTSRLSEFHQRYSPRVQFVAINSNQQDSLAEIQHFVRTRSLPFPVLKDPGNRIADLFRATRTPEVFVLNGKREVVYGGCIDDQYGYGVQKSRVEHNYLGDALEATLGGRPVERAVTQPIGCLIGRRREPHAKPKVTYAREISRILQAHCVACHRSGEIAPFELTEYDEVVGWAGMIDEVVQEQRMPPWHAESEPGHFKNDARLSPEEKTLIHEWVEAGAPLGSLDDLPPPRHFAEGWQIDEPDQVIAMGDEPFAIPATGVVPYQYLVVDPGFTEDKWVVAAECRPGNRAVVHHIIVGVMGEGEFGRGVHGDLQSEWIAATAPGAAPMVLPPGYAKLIPAGSKLVFQMHYTPNGSAQTDLSQIGLVYGDPAEITHQVLTLMAYDDDFRIPAGASSHQVVATYRFGRPLELLSMFPHMHYRGKSFTYDFELPDGQRQRLLSVPRYDFNWQNAYHLAESRHLPAGTRLTCTAEFDNSAQNLANPDPTKAVSWGDQTWEEMMIGYFDVAVARDE